MWRIFVLNLRKSTSSAEWQTCDHLTYWRAIRTAACCVRGPPMAAAGSKAKSSPRRWQHALQSLRHRNYRIFLAGQLASLVGTWIDTVAESWLIYRLTNSAVLLGMAGFVSQFPVFILSPL